MSTDALFVLVEGVELDRFFYDGLCRSSGRVVDAGHKIYLVESIKDEGTGSGAGGKGRLTRLFDYYRRRHALVQYSRAGKHSLLFCADRDAQDLSGGMRRSPHFLYTQNHDVEADIFAAADAKQALAALLSLDWASAMELRTALGDWQEDLAVLWKGWIELCIIAQALNAHCGVTYKKMTSEVNSPTYGPVSLTKIVALRSQVIAVSGLSAAEFAKKEAGLMRRIASRYSRSQGKTLAKGKWFPSYLEYRVRNELGQKPASLHNFRPSVTRVFMNSVDFRGSWADRVRASVEALL